MATTSTTALLDAWEHGRDASPGERGLILLGVAHPEASASTLSDWPVGRRDAEPEAASSLAVTAAQPIRIPAGIAAALESEMTGTIAAADPLAEIALELACPDCAATWSAPFDIVRFLWSEVDAWAARTLDEVHVLASHYGWSEAEILALSPQRRQHYRDLIGP